MGRKGLTMPDHDDVLDTPQAVVLNEIPASMRWNLNAVFDLEVIRIKRWLAARADLILGKRGASLSKAKIAGDVLSQEIMMQFGSRDEQRSQVLLRKASAGELERSAPTPGKIAAFTFLKWIAALAEVAVFVVTALLGLTNHFVIIVGVLLGLVGWLAGYGAARLSIRGRSDIQGWITVLFGVIGIFSLAIVRAGGPANAPAVIVITVILAFAVAFFAWLELIHRDMFERAQSDMYRCQRWHASDLHAHYCEEGFWQRYYSSVLASIEKEDGQRLTRALATSELNPPSSNNGGIVDGEGNA
jgi:hypothetical protein